MIIITVARKPVNETVAANALRHGTGGLNIDGCRITFTTIPGGSLAVNTHLRESVKRTASVLLFSSRVGVYKPPAGRWPANLMLVHWVDCVPSGHIRIRGNRIDTRPEGDGGRTDKSQWRFRPTSRTRRGYSESDGNETVAKWTCTAGCPVTALDGQSGVTGTGTGVAQKAGAGKAQPFATDKGWHAHHMTREGQIAPEDYGDLGGASRFFKQFGGKR